MKNRIWLITDTHFNHRKMEEYCNRPKDFEEIILRNLKIIKSNDTIIHLGDFCIGRDEYWHGVWNNLLATNRKILVRGNHDKKTDSWYLNHGWSIVCESFSGHYFGNYITFSHRLIPNIQNLNIHGHFHNNLDRLLKGNFVVEGEKERNEKDLTGLNNNHILLSLEYTNYKPVLLNTLCKKK